MREQKLYDPIGEWLIENKGCQNNNYFQGYTKEPRIEERTKTREPDVVGIRYEEDQDKKTPSFSFDYYFVEVKRQTDPGDLNELFGQMESLKKVVKNPGVEVAARNAEYYIAFENEVPESAMEMAKEKGYGVLVVDTDNDEVVNVRESRTPEQVDIGKGTVVANKNQESIGNFRREVEGAFEGDVGTMILKKVMTDPDAFFENVMRPLLEEYDDEKNRRSFVRDNDILAEVVEFLEEQENVSLDFEGNSIGVEVIDGGDWEIEIMKTRFKIHDPAGELLLRVTDDGEITVFSDDIGTVEESSDVISVIQNMLIWFGPPIVLSLPGSTHRIQDLVLRRYW